MYLASTNDYLGKEMNRLNLLNATSGDFRWPALWSVAYFSSPQLQFPIQLGHQMHHFLEAGVRVGLQVTCPDPLSPAVCLSLEGQVRALQGLSGLFQGHFRVTENYDGGCILVGLPPLSESPSTKP